MTLNLQTFFAYARRAPFGGSLSTAQVEGCKRILATCRAERVLDLRQVAYVLASVFHETGARMQPVREAFASGDAGAIAALDKAWKAGKLGKVKEPYWRKGWFGRGDIQITHEANYRKLGNAIGVDLVANPALALDPATSARIAVVGMRDGLFRYSAAQRRPERLADYFTPQFALPQEARAIVNGGRDKAKLIAGHWRAFLDALEAADLATPQPTDVVAADAEPDDVPVAASGSAGTIAVVTAGGVATAAGGVATAAVTGISNQWALAAFALLLLFLLIAGGIGGWLVVSGRLTINRSKAAA